MALWLSPASLCSEDKERVEEEESDVLWSVNASRWTLRRHKHERRGYKMKEKRHSSATVGAED